MTTLRSSTWGEEMAIRCINCHFEDCIFESPFLHPLSTSLSCHPERSEGSPLILQYFINFTYYKIGLHLNTIANYEKNIIDSNFPSGSE